MVLHGEERTGGVSEPLHGAVVQVDVGDLHGLAGGAKRFLVHGVAVILGADRNHDILPSAPALVVAGINFGENVGYGITISGTVGAVLEAAAGGLRALAVSQATSAEQKDDIHCSVDLSAAGFFTARFAGKLLAVAPAEAPILKVDVPLGATSETQWMLTRLSRTRYYQPVRLGGKTVSEPAQISFRVQFDPRREEPGSDVYALHVEKKVSVTPLGLDLTARTDFSAVEAVLRDPD